MRGLTPLSATLRWFAPVGSAQEKDAPSEQSPGSLPKAGEPKQKPPDLSVTFRGRLAAGRDHEPGCAATLGPEIKSLRGTHHSAFPGLTVLIKNS